jgi:hypothetical protein
VSGDPPLVRSAEKAGALLRRPEEIMQRFSIVMAVLVGCGFAFPLTSLGGCGGTHGSGFENGSSGFGGSGGSNGGSGAGGSGGSSGGFGTSSGSGSGYVPDGGWQCPAGLQCNVACSGGGMTTTISGTVLDPAGNNPLYNVAVYVPIVPLEPLPRGVPQGGDSCSCGALFKSGAITTAQTGVDGTFTLKDAPVGSQVPLVLQIGKWRRLVHINVTACQDNPQPMGSLTLPGTVSAGDTDDNIPDIAVSMGYADTLECLMHRMGVADSEYVLGNSMSGHIHLFNGGTGTAKPTPTSKGAQNPAAASGTPASDTSLWDSQADLMPYDITLLSCEGGEAYDAKPANLEAYLNAGGRVFASHFHYSWFSGPISSGQGYTAPMDWGSNLATWGAAPTTNYGPIGGAVVQTLNLNGMPFPKGQALDQWLNLVGGLALAGNSKGVNTGDVPIFDPRYNAVVTSTQKPSQPWITSDGSGTGGMAGETMYFSFDTPVNLNPPTGPDQTGVNYCGRAVFSDLHVGGNYTTKDERGTGPAPMGCSSGPTMTVGTRTQTVALSEQEMVLEFMLFDLSSCVVPDTISPPPPVQPTPQ